MQDAVKNNCSPDLLTVHYLDTLVQANEKMKQKNIRHLPVVDDEGNVVGILSDIDAKKSAWAHAEISIHPENHSLDISNQHVYKYMNWPVHSIDEKASTIEATRMMLDHKVSALLVTHGRTAIGIITTEDLLRKLLVIQDHDSLEVNALTVKYYSSPIRSLVESLASIGI